MRRVADARARVDAVAAGCAAALELGGELYAELRSAFPESELGFGVRSRVVDVFMECSRVMRESCW